MFNATVLLTVIAVSLHLVGPAAQAGPLLQQYFPLQTGDQKTFTATIGGNAVQEIQTLSSTNFDGNDVVAGSAVDTYYGGSGVTVYLNYSGDQLLWYGASLSACAHCAAGGATLAFDPPLVFLDEQTLANGGTHKSSSTATVTGHGPNSQTYPVTYSYTVTSAGTVTVPAGTFSNCVQVTGTVTVKNVGHPAGTATISASGLILAPDVGVVQEPIFQIINIQGAPFQIGVYQLAQWSVALPYTYTTNNSAITITGYNCSEGDVTIPNTILALPVTSIGSNAFYGCTNLTSVTIPASVTSIGDYAFYDCTSLMAVYFQGNAAVLDGPSVFATATGYDPATVCYLPGATGFGTTFGGLPTALFSSSSCTNMLSATSVTLTAKGGSKNISVKVNNASCAWTAASNDPFITITFGSSGTGNGKVVYSVPGNTNTTALSGTMTIAGRTFTVNQAAGGCTFKLGPKVGKIKATGGSATVKVTPNFSDCTWTAVSNDSLATITAGASGTGKGTVSYTVPANTSTNVLTGTITIAGQTFTVIQAGAK